MSCDVSCYHSHVPLYCPRKIKETEKKRKIKLKKMDKKNQNKI